MGKSSRSKDTEGRRDSGQQAQSRALANLLSYENEDSESPTEDSNDGQVSQAKTPTMTSSLAMQPRSVLGLTPVKFALKSHSKVQKLNVKPPEAAQGSVRVASKWDDPDDEADSVIRPPLPRDSQSGLKKIELYGSELSKEGTPVSDDAAHVQSRVQKSVSFLCSI